MIKHLIIYILTFVSAVVHAQSNYPDSLKSRLKSERNDTLRLILYEKLFEHYQENDPETAIKYGRAELVIARKFQSPFQEALVLNNMGFVLMTLQNKSEALQKLLRGLELVEDEGVLETALPLRYLMQLPFLEPMNDTRSFYNQIVYDLHHNLSQLYSILGEKDKEIEHFQSAKAIAFKSKLPYPIYEVTGNDGSILFKKGRYKDALVTYFKSLQLAEKLKNKKYLVFTLSYIANAYHKLGDKEKAKQFYWKAIASAKAHNNTRGLLYPYSGISLIHNQSNRLDSVLWYARRSLAIAKSNDHKTTIAGASNYLSNYYKNKGNMDSAYYYLEASTSVRNELNSTQKAREIQNIMLAENQRKADVLAAKTDFNNRLKLYGLGVGLFFLSLITFLLWRNNRERRRANAILNEQKSDLENAVQTLKTTQSQLIQSEKMASLGELTAGIAHEIQNPLNFVNNFSEVSLELIEEVKSEKLKAKSQRNEELENELLEDISQNLQKISHHGKRADFIVKGMLQHSRTSTGEKQLTNINTLADEFLKLSYHGLRAKDKSFNAELVTNFDKNLPKVNVVQQEIGRVLLNLFNNAFYAVQEKRKTESEKLKEDYMPTVEVSTLAKDGFVVITVKDNGFGIPEGIKNKIMQPFFTTKPTGEGTGLGLSLSYDIVKAHGGELKMESSEGEYTEFSIIMPSKPILVA